VGGEGAAGAAGAGRSTFGADAAAAAPGCAAASAAAPRASRRPRCSEAAARAAAGVIAGDTVGGRLSELGAARGRPRARTPRGAPDTMGALLRPPGLTRLPPRARRPTRLPPAAAARPRRDRGAVAVAAPPPPDESAFFLEPLLRSFVLGVGAGAAYEAAHVVVKVGGVSSRSGWRSAWVAAGDDGAHDGGARGSRRVWRATRTPPPLNDVEPPPLRCRDADASRTPHPQLAAAAFDAGALLAFPPPPAFLADHVVAV
jgi:hypothetical protein